jgi:leucyl aminopeptidase (aminopeptidase T)
MAGMARSPDDVDAGAMHLITELTGLRPDEVVVLVADGSSDPRAAVAVTAAVEAAGAGVSQVDPRGFLDNDSASPDLVISLAAPLLTHSDQMRRLLTAGARYLNLRGVTCESLAEVVSVDFPAIQTVTEDLARRLARSKSVTVADRQGTRVRFRPGPSLRLDGLARTPGAIGGYPAGEVALVPEADSLSGQIVQPLFVEGFAERAPKLTLRIDGGQVTDVSGGPAAALLAEFFDSGDCCRLVGEFGVGTNPSLRIRTAREAKKALGTAHFGLGDNRSFGGSNAAPGHIDVILAEPAVFADESVLLSDGRPPWRREWK